MHLLDADEPRRHGSGRAGAPKRFGGAGIMASRKGSATVAPIPFNTARRDRCFPVRNTAKAYPFFFFSFSPVHFTGPMLVIISPVIVPSSCSVTTIGLGAGAA